MRILNRSTRVSINENTNLHWMKGLDRKKVKKEKQNANKGGGYKGEF